MTITYIPSKDELLLKIRLVKRKPSKEKDGFKLWWDNEGNICAIAIIPYTKEIEEFRKNLHTIRLGGLWKGIKITDEDINETREELLTRLEERW